MTKLMMIAALAATTAFATPALAATTTTGVSAQIASVCTLTAPANNSTINLSGSTDLHGVSVTCNDPAGFTASVSSANAGFLKDATSKSPTTFAYNLDFGPGGVRALTSPVSVDSATYGSGALAASVAGVSLPVSLNVTKQNGPSFAGVYSDTITWSILAN